MSSDAWSGNRGEWGEGFTLLQLLSHNKLYSADGHGMRIADQFGIVEAVYRTEVSGLEIEFRVEPEDERVAIIHNGRLVRYVSKALLAENAHSLFGRMKTQSRGASHPEGAFLQGLGCESLKASSLMKADIDASIYDGLISSHARRNYSIKTLVGGRPSIGNASGQSLIEYTLPGFDSAKAAEVLSINKETCKSWVVGRARKVIELCDGTPKPVIPSRTFEMNLRKCYYCAPEVVALATLYGQTCPGKWSIEIIKLLNDIDPLGCLDDDEEAYECAIRSYIWGIVFGLVPGHKWVKAADVDGYLIVTDEEEVLSYQTSRKRIFEDYLLLHAAWDTPSTSRWGGADLFQREDGSWAFTLNCAVRFDKNEYKGPNAVAAGVDPGLA